MQTAEISPAANCGLLTSAALGSGTPLLPPLSLQPAHSLPTSTPSGYIFSWKIIYTFFIQREPQSWKEICDAEVLIYFHVLVLRVHFPENTEAIVNVMSDFLSGDGRRTKIY